MDLPIKYLSWHYIFAVKFLLTVWNNFLIFTYHFFSTSLLLRTLLAPWKKQTAKTAAVFPLERFVESLTFNAVSRIMGAIIRATTLLLSVGTLLLVTYIGLSIFFFWFLIPLLTLPLYLWLSQPSHLAKIRKSSQTLKELTLALLPTPEVTFILNHLTIDYKQLQPAVETFNDASLTEDVRQAKSIAELFVVVSHRWLPLASFFKEKNVSPEDIIQVAEWHDRKALEREKKMRFWELENLLSIPGVGSTWSYGYSVNLERFATPITRTDDLWGEVTGREEEIHIIEKDLSKTISNSILLVGDPGVGKHPLLQTLARRIEEGRVYPSLRHKRLLILSLAQLLKDTTDTTQIKGNVLALLAEAREAGNIILVISDLDRYLHNSASTIDLSDILIEALTGARLQIIGIVTREQYHQYLENNHELLAYFNKIDIGQPNKQSTMLTLQNAADFLEKRDRLTITFQALKEIMAKSSYLLPDEPFPQKALTILDDVVSYATNEAKIQLILTTHVDTVLSQMSHIPLGELKAKEKDLLLRLPELMHRNIVNQEKAIEAITNAMRRTRLDLSRTDKPIGSFLFMGPTGVGKTATAKTLAQIYFGSQDHFLRFDMSEYQGEIGVRQLVGTGDGHPGLLASGIRDKPFGVLLLDEFEKASKDVHNLFLTIFDEGYFYDPSGKKVLCTNLIIIATTNAGAEFIRETLQKPLFVADTLGQSVIDYILMHNLFSPELINRFDACIAFSPLSLDHIRQIADLELRNLAQGLKEKHNITLSIDTKMIALIAKEGYNPEFGARPMKRVIQEKVEDVIAQKLLSGEIDRGSLVSL